MMKKFVIGLCVGLLLLGGILVSVYLDGSPYDNSKVVQFETEDGTALEGVLYAEAHEDNGDGQGETDPGVGGDGHCGG